MKVAIVGATGAVGQELVAQCLCQSSIEQVLVLARKAMPVRLEAQLESQIAQSGTSYVVSDYLKKLVWKTTDFVDIDAFFQEYQPDQVFCALGTTIKQAGSKSAFRKVDLELPIQVAHSAREAGARAFHYVSAMGANKQSAVFYNRVKGEAEALLKDLELPSLFIYRPSLIDVDREEIRFGEALARRVTRWIQPMLPRSVQPITPKKIAASMLISAKQCQGADLGEQIVSNPEMLSA